jgi:class 3 adenylate cyclase/predicted ATPase
MQCPHCQAIIPDNFKFCGECGTPLTIAASPTLPSTAPPLSQDGERRQLTVLFCDMVGSTAIAERLDPEELSDLLRAYHLACTSAIRQFNGYLAQYLGDGILAYFGYPQACEDAAERAVRAGLAIIDAVIHLNLNPGQAQGVKLAVRVGIATGLVVTDHRLTGDTDDPMVVGQTLNLAARLQNLAAPNTVIITSPIQRQLSGLFEYEDLGQQQLKGFSQPLQVWRVARPRTVITRFVATRVAELTPLVGRTAELDRLRYSWQQVLSSTGQVVLLAGEAGIGKSRLTQALREYLRDQDHYRLHYQCSPYHTNSALYPLISNLERAAGFLPADSADQRLDKLEALLAQSTPCVQEVAVLFAHLLGLPTQDRYPPLRLTPSQQKDKTLWTLIAQLQNLAERKPVLVVFEDVHWMDPTSHEALDLLIASARAHRLLILITFRPEFLPPWTDQPHVTLLTLTGLDRDQGITLARQIAVNKPLPAAMLEQFVTKTDGVPLFIEELTRTLVSNEACTLQTQQPALLNLSPPAICCIPATLQDSLMARLDQLSLAKTIAQIGSVIGREFNYELLSEVAPLSERQLRDALQQLATSGLILCYGNPPQAHYSFRHALLRDAAYDSLLRNRRQQLHGLIANALEARPGPAGTGHAELLAYHYTAAGLRERAVACWLQAGTQAQDRSANREAVAHFRQGLDVLGKLLDTGWRRQQELELQIHLGTTLITTQGPGSREVAAAYHRALDLCQQLPETPLHFTALWGWWRISGNFQTFRERADQLLDLAERLQDPSLRLQAHHCQWAVLFNLGDHQACLEHIEQGLTLYRQGDYHTHAGLYGGHDPAVCGHGEAALSLWLLGYPDQALVRLHNALTLARQLGQVGSQAHALDIALMLHFYRRDLDGVQAQADVLAALAREQDFPDYQAKCQIFHGWVLAHRGHPQDAIAAIQTGITTLREIGTQEDFPTFFDILAEACGLAGQPWQGLLELQAAFTAAEHSGRRHWAAELYRRQGELLVQAGGDAAEATAILHKALHIAGQQQVRSLRLRAATSLACWLRYQGDVAAARQRLLPVYNDFSEGLDTPDLRQARELLVTLSSSVCEIAV